MKNQQSRAFSIERNCDAYAAGIAAVVRAAFQAKFGNGDGEVAIVEALRADGDVITELAAVEDGAVLGHAMFSRMIAKPSLCRVAALGPVCARTDRQKRGIGSALIRAGLDICREGGVDAVMVLGDTVYYGRFGFSTGAAQGIACAFAGPHLQALEISPGALRGVTALAYAPAFSAV